MGDVAVEIAVPAGAQHPEGPSWDASTARLWWVDIMGEQVHCLDPESGKDTSWPTHGQPGGVVLDEAGEPVVATPDGLASLDRTTGATSQLVPVEVDRPENRANDIKVDSRGRAWVGTMAYDKRPGSAALYRIVGDRATTMVDGLTICNGPTFDEKRGLLYFADTALSLVDVCDLDVRTGELTDRRRFVDVSAQQIWPDGMTVDDDGMVWIAMGRGGAVHRYRLDGALDGVVHVPTSNPTSVAFGGADGGDLYITTSWFDCEHRASQPLAGAIFRCRPGTTGPPAVRWMADSAATPTHGAEHSVKGGTP
jgi:sugar lactone lactonase YvrE